MPDASEIRRIAIDHHDARAPQFEKWYSDYEKDCFSNAFTYGRAKLDAMVDDLFADLPEGGQVLDVGCGTGEHLKRAQRHGLIAVGLEPAPAMLEAAKVNVPDARLDQGVATELPFEDNAFDAVLMIEVLRYLDAEDTQLALREARRVLKPGGKLLATLVNRWAADGFYILQRLRQRCKGNQCDVVNPNCLFFTPAEAEDLLADAGFVEVRTEGRMLAPLRIAYKISEPLGRGLARLVDRLDDRVHSGRAATRFAGHLIAIGSAP